MKAHIKISLIVLLLAVVPVLACGTTDPSEPVILATATLLPSPLQLKDTPEVAPIAVEEPTVTPEPTALPRLGDVVENYGYSLSAVAIEDPASSPGIFYQPEEGKKLVAVEFILGNVAGETISSNELYTTLVDTEGFLYAVELGGVENELELLELNPGEKVKGWVGFLIPLDATPAILKYEIDYSYFGEELKVLQVGLTTE